MQFCKLPRTCNISKHRDKYNGVAVKISNCVACGFMYFANGNYCEIVTNIFNKKQ